MPVTILMNLQVPKYGSDGANLVVVDDSAT